MYPLSSTSSEAPERQTFSAKYDKKANERKDKTTPTTFLLTGLVGLMEEEDE